ncbi:MAG TPA: hypothetical protein PKA88_31170 [Polyangiaceae bacterium]|nr:hypothetical protein [Polyangiaceae bacterium]HMR74964.1 hypothetical protein [Polyangiaceae bacterium]
MQNGPTLPAQQAGQVASARGAFRDALGSLRNLEQLLGSLRVGPRNVSTVLPAVHASCGIIARASKQLLAVVSDESAARALDEFITPRVRELDRALTSAIPKPMYAKNRLRLERVVKRVGAELDAARALVDLLSPTTPTQALRVDLAELMRGAVLADKTAAGASRAPVSKLDLPDVACESLVPPQVLQQLLGIAAALVVGDGEGAAQIRLEPRQDACVIEVRFEPGATATQWLASPPSIEPSLASATAIAQLGGGTFRFSAAERFVEMRWPR